MIGLLEKYVLKRPVSKRAEIAVHCVFVFFACFQAWRDQYQKTQTANQTPIQITMPPINVPPTQVIVTDSDKHAPAIRKLGKLLGDGTQLRDGICSSRGPATSQCLKARTRWEKQVESTLRSELDSSYEARWRSELVPSFMSDYYAMATDVTNLGNLIAEIR